MELIHIILLSIVALLVLAFAGASNARKIDKITDKMMEE